MAKPIPLLRSERPMATFGARSPGLPPAVTKHPEFLPSEPSSEWDENRPDATKTDIIASPFLVVENDPGERAALEGYVVCREVKYSGLPHVQLAVLEDEGGARRTVSVQRLQRQAGVDPRSSTPGFSPDGLLGCHVRHPNLFSVLDVIEAKGELLLVMEYVASETLGRLEAKGNRLPIPISVAIARSVLHALSAAHGARSASGEALEIIHSNIDPDNILVGADGVPRLVHFARAAKERSVAPPTGPVKGKSRYIAPEQVFDQQVDARTDLFQVGVVLWESLTGRRLIAGGSAVDCMLRFISSGARPPSEANPNVEKALDAVLLRALEPTPARRFQSAAEFAEALETAVSPAPRAEVARYVEAVARDSIREQRAFLGEAPIEETPTTCVRLASMFREVPALRPQQPTVPDEADEPTAALGQFLGDALQAELDSHWSSRDADELTAVDGATKKPVVPSDLQLAWAPASAWQPTLVKAAALPRALVAPVSPKPVARATAGSEPEIAYSAEASSADEALELADAVSDFDESWVHPAPHLKSSLAAGPFSEAPSDEAMGVAGRFGRGALRGATWSLAFALVFAATFFVTKTINDAGYRARTAATLHALVSQAVPAVAAPRTAPPAAIATKPLSTQVRQAHTPMLRRGSETAAAPASSGAAARVLRLEELPLAPKAQIKKVRSKSVSRAKRQKSLAPKPSTSTPATVSSPDVVTLTEE